MYCSRKLIALNVAEKPSVAKNVVGILSKNNFNKLESLSKYNPIYEFDYIIKDIEYNMRFTSIRGHLMSWEFPQRVKNWDLKSIPSLYDCIILII